MTQSTLPVLTNSSTATSPLQKLSNFILTAVSSVTLISNWTTLNAALPKLSATTAPPTRMEDATMAKEKDQVVDDHLKPILVVGGDTELHPLLLVPVHLLKVKGKERASPVTDATKANPPIAHPLVTVPRTMALKPNPKKPVDIVVATILPATSGNGRMRNRKMG